MTRTANFSSSSIWKLTKSGRGKDDYFGSPALTYIEEKRMESRLGLPLSTEHNASPTNWGKLVEALAFDRLPLDYRLVSDVRYSHPSITNWTGMPDVVNADVSGDIKAPFTRKAFCGLVDAMSEGPEAVKDHSPEYYWQIVSNCILTGKSKGGLFVYCPYKSNLLEIRDRAAGWLGEENMTFINYMNDNELPYLKENGHYKDYNELIFDVPKEDVEFLTDRVQEAVKLLTNVVN
jgi:hypothetical protein